MANYYKEVDGVKGWYTCGCGNTPVELIKNIPEGSVEMVFMGAINRTLRLSSGSAYNAAPGTMVALDVAPSDVEELSRIDPGIGRPFARLSVESDRTLPGYLSRISIPQPA